MVVLKLRTLFFSTSVLALATACAPYSEEFYPYALRNPDGELIYFEDIQEITNDPDFSEEEQREKLRALGIEDEELINLLIEL